MPTVRLIACPTLCIPYDITSENVLLMPQFRVGACHLQGRGAMMVVDACDDTEA